MTVIIERQSSSLRRRILWVKCIRWLIAAAPLGTYVLVLVLFFIANELLSRSFSSVHVPVVTSVGENRESIMEVMWAVSSALYFLTSLMTLLMTALYIVTFASFPVRLGVFLISAVAGVFAFFGTFIETSIQLITNIPQEMRTPVAFVKDAVAAVVAASMVFQVACVTFFITKTQGRARALKFSRLSYYLHLLILLSGVSLAFSIINVYYTHIWPAVLTTNVTGAEGIEEVATAIALFAGSQATLYLAAIYVPAVLIFRRASHRLARRGGHHQDVRGPTFYVSETLAIFSPLIAAPLAAVAERFFG